MSTEAPSFNRPRMPRGVRDLLPGELRELKALEERLLEVFSLWGYQPVRTPSYEFRGSAAPGGSPGRPVGLAPAPLPLLRPGRERARPATGHDHTHRPPGGRTAAAGALASAPLLRRERLPLRRTPSWPEPGVPPGGGGADRQPLPRGRRGGGGLGQPPAGGAGAPELPPGDWPRGLRPGSAGRAGPGPGDGTAPPADPAAPGLRRLPTARHLRPPARRSAGGAPPAPLPPGRRRGAGPGPGTGPDAPGPGRPGQPGGDLAALAGPRRGGARQA